MRSASRRPPRQTQARRALPALLLWALLIAPAGAATRTAKKARLHSVALRDADARTLAKRYSELTGRNVLLGGAGVEGGKVTVLAPRPVSRAVAERLYVAAFERLGLTLVRTGRMWRVVPLREAASGPLPLYVPQR